MKKNKKIYNVINLLFLSLALLLANYSGIFNMKLPILSVILCVVLVLIIHSIKFFKLYFVALEEKIPFKDMVKIYIKSTFVSIILPFKLGEFYKAYLLGYKGKSYINGFTAVIVDKLFDAILLCLVVIPYSIYKNNPLSPLGWTLFLIIILFLLLYSLFPRTYKYLNRFFIGSKQSKNNLIALNLLEESNNFYIKIKNMIRGRELVLTILTSLYWALEFLFVSIVNKAQVQSTGLGNIVNYINDAFLGISNNTYNVYVYLSSSVFLIIIGFIYIKRLLPGGKK